MPNFTFPKSPSVTVNTSQKKGGQDVILSPEHPPSPTVIGTSHRGPAFVPFYVQGGNEFERLFGNSHTEFTGTLAVKNWWKNDGGGALYVRTLGAGDCMPRLSSGDNFGSVKNAGFVVGQQLVNTGSGRIGNNAYVYDQTTPEKATATILISDSGGISHGDTFTLVDSVGTSTVYTINGGVAPAAGGGSGGSATVGFLGIGGGAAGKAAAADSMAIAINATTDANYTAVSDGVERVTITQGAAGYDGNRQNNDSIGHTAVSNFVGGLGGSEGLLGRSYFLGCFMSESNGSTIFSDAGIQDLNTSAAAHPIVRGILFAPSGVTLTLVNKREGNNTPTSNGPGFGHLGTYGDGGAAIGSVYINEGKSAFTLLLNGHEGTAESPSAITTSFDPQAMQSNGTNDEPAYFVEKFNTDPIKIQEKGHYLYCHYDMMITRAVVTGSGRIAESAGANAPANVSSGWEPSAFLLSSSYGRNVGSATSIPLGTVGAPNFENFEDRFVGGFTPFITSQKIEGKSRNLFRFYTLSSGDISLGEVKVTIRNIRPSLAESKQYSQFDVDIRAAYDSDKNPFILKSFINCDLDPKSNSFISKQVGDFNLLHDFDASSLDSRKTVLEGSYTWRNQYIRVEVSPEVENSSLPTNAMPCGFRGVYHLVTSGSGALLTDSEAASSTFNGLAALASDNGTELKLLNTAGSSVTFTTDANFSYTAGFGTSGGDLTKIGIGTGNITSDKTATQALWTAFDYAIALGVLKMTLTPSVWPVSGLTEITLTQNDLGALGNSNITIPANITANGTTGAGTGAFTGGLTVPVALLTGSMSSAAIAHQVGVSTDTLQNIVQPPIPFRQSLAFEDSSGIKSFTQQVKNEVYGNLTWGVQYEKKANNKNTSTSPQIDSSVFSHLKFFPSFQTVNQNVYVGDNENALDVGGCVLDADRFNNNFFSLENILVITGSTKDERDERLPDPEEWPAAIYRRNRKIPEIFKNANYETTDKVRFFDPEFDLSDEFSVTPFIKFTVPMMGGFSGLNIFDYEKYHMTNEAVRRENTDPLQFGKKDSTTAAYRKCLDILKEKQSANTYLIAVPGIRQQSVTDHAVDVAEERFDALSILDIERLDVSGSAVTSSIQDVNLIKSINQFSSRHMQNSFAAAYFPDVQILFTFADEADKLNPDGLVTLPVMSPPSVAMLGVIAQNDSTAGVHAAPMGPTRGNILDSNITEMPVLLDSEIARVTNAGVNPIITAENGIYPASQVTTLKDNTMFDRINLRRLLIDIRRSIGSVAKDHLFLPANTTTLSKLKLAMKNAMLSYQNSGAISKYKVVVDSELFLKRVDSLGNISWADAIPSAKPSGLDRESNIIRGKIIIVPTQSDKMVELDISEPEE